MVKDFLLLKGVNKIMTLE